MHFLSSGIYHHPCEMTASLLFQADLLSPQQLVVGIDTGVLFVFKKVPRDGVP